jgi:hypothetical protein
MKREFFLFPDEFCASSTSSATANGPDGNSSPDPVVVFSEMQPTLCEDLKYAAVVDFFRKEEKLIKKEFGLERANSEEMRIELKKRIETIFPDYEMNYSKNEKGVNILG